MLAVSLRNRALIGGTMSHSMISMRVSGAALLILLTAGMLSGQVMTRDEEQWAWQLKVDIVKEKIDRFLLPAMRSNNIDMWIVMSRENNLDPIIADIGGGIGGHRNAYLFMDDGSDRVKRIVIGTHLGDIIQTRIYDDVIVYGKEGLKPYLRKAVHDFDPRRIGINTSRTIPMCDGLTVEMKKYLEDAIGPVYTDRLVSAEKLVVSFRVHRLEREVELMRKSFEIAKRIHHEVLSNEVIRPGITTGEDLYWAYREKLRKYNVEPGWPGACPFGVPVEKGELLLSEIVIEPGDFIDVNFGVKYMGYCSDVNRQAYVLKPGETEPPKPIRDFFEFSLKFARELKKNMVPGERALDIHTKTMRFLQDSGYDGWVGAHTIGDTVHCIGPLLYPDYPERYGERVNLRLDPVMLFAVEMGISKEIPSMGRSLSLTRQDDAVLRADGVEYLSPPQTELILIKPIP